MAAAFHLILIYQDLTRVLAGRFFQYFEHQPGLVVGDLIAFPFHRVLVALT